MSGAAGEPSRRHLSHSHSTTAREGIIPTCAKEPIGLTPGPPTLSVARVGWRYVFAGVNPRVRRKEVFVLYLQRVYHPVHRLRLDPAERSDTAWQLDW